MCVFAYWYIRGEVTVETTVYCNRGFYGNDAMVSLVRLSPVARYRTKSVLDPNILYAIMTWTVLLGPGPWEHHYSTSRKSVLMVVITLYFESVPLPLVNPTR